jgi:hypothetical protein
LGEKDANGGVAPAGAAGGAAAASFQNGPVRKMYIAEEGSSSANMNMVQVVTQLLGAKFDF